MKRALVTGAGGFIGTHLVTYLKSKGYWVRGVDVKYPQWTTTDANEFLIRDMRYVLAANDAVQGGFDECYALAADMGGMGFISFHAAEILHNNALINLNTIEAARHAHIPRYLFTSSACVYPGNLQENVEARALKEADAYPAWPDTEYGWEKLYTEHVCLGYADAYGMEVRIPRFHNTYGPLGAWTGGREKAPAALCRKIAECKQTGQDHIEIWGDGEQTRSFNYVSDTVEGLYRLMQSHYRAPMNIGSDRAVSINDLARLIMQAAGVDLEIRHIEGPQGVRGRNSDNTLSKAVLDWEPQITLEAGLAWTYAWIEERVCESVRA